MKAHLHSASSVSFAKTRNTYSVNRIQLVLFLPDQYHNPFLLVKTSIQSSSDLSLIASAFRLLPLNSDPRVGYLASSPSKACWDTIQFATQSTPARAHNVPCTFSQPITQIIQYKPARNLYRSSVRSAHRTPAS